MSWPLYIKIPLGICVVGQIIYILLDIRKRRVLTRSERLFYGDMSIYPILVGFLLYYFIVIRPEKKVTGIRQIVFWVSCSISGIAVP